MTEKTHLTQDLRLKLEGNLNANKSFKEIGEILGKDPTTISREVKKHSVIERSGGSFHKFNDCRWRKTCAISLACEKSNTCNKQKCCYCEEICCTEKCPAYERYECPRLKKPPHVCNGCGEYHKCTLEKRVYHAEEAQTEYKEVLSGSRQVLKCTSEDLAILDATFQKGFKKGQSINHIFVAAEDHIGISKSTAYKYINDGVFTNVCRLDEPKAVRYKARKKMKPMASPKNYMVGYTYADWLIRQSETEMPYVEMDCVEGKRTGNGRVLLTLLFSGCNLQLAYILEKKDTMHVCAVHKALQQQLGYAMYRSLFGLILTDRGLEFSDPRSISIGPGGELFTEIYYCDPMNSNQKAHCERNHSEIRRVIPKGTDIVCSQDRIDFMMDNINSMPRPALGNKSAYEHFCFLHGKEAADALGLKKIPAEDVTLKPYILL